MKMRIRGVAAGLNVRANPNHANQAECPQLLCYARFSGANPLNQNY